MDFQAKILIVDCDHNACDYLENVLATEGYEAKRTGTGKNAISKIAVSDPDLVLMELDLPDIHGLKVLKSIREWSDTPIIILSAKSNEADKVEALDAGANDYITKPFGNNELLARIRAVLRFHKKLISIKTNTEDSLHIGDLIFDYNKRIIKKNHKSVHLTPIEYKIAVLLSQNAGKVLSHDYIIRNIWGPYESDSQILRVNMANIRRKLEMNPAEPKYILTEARVGYKMIDPEDYTC